MVLYLGMRFFVYLKIKIFFFYHFFIGDQGIFCKQCYHPCSFRWLSGLLLCLSRGVLYMFLGFLLGGKYLLVSRAPLLPLLSRIFFFLIYQRRVSEWRLIWKINHSAFNMTVWKKDSYLPPSGLCICYPLLALETENLDQFYFDFNPSLEINTGYQKSARSGFLS